MEEVVDSHWYLSRGESARRHGARGYIHDYPDTAFLALFRMRRPT